MRYLYAAEIAAAILTVWAVVLIDTRRAALERRARHGDEPELDTDPTRGTLDDQPDDGPGTCWDPVHPDPTRPTSHYRGLPIYSAGPAPGSEQWIRERYATWPELDDRRPDPDRFFAAPNAATPGTYPQPDPYPELDPDHPDAVRHRRHAHVCTYACRCPIHETAAVYSHIYGDHACQQVTCQYGSGGLLRVT